MMRGAQVRNGDNSEKTRRAQQEAFRRFNLGPEVERMYPFQLSEVWQKNAGFYSLSM